ncbi:hypothetical protein [Endozoicomonas acroporae]
MSKASQSPFNNLLPSSAFRELAQQAVQAPVEASQWQATVITETHNV